MGYKGVKDKIPSAPPHDYDQTTDFSTYEANNPGVNFRGTDLDAELANIEKALDETQDRLSIIQNDDGSLQNQSVGADQLKPEVAFGLNQVSTWATNTDYKTNVGVWHVRKLYRCLVRHTSGTFSTDLTNGKWELLVDHDQWLTIAETKATEASNSATAAKTSETNAKTSETNAGAHATDAGQHKQTAERWANLTTGTVVDVDTAVDSGEYSAKAYAQSSGLLATGSAKEWAAKLSGTVDGTYKSSKQYAEDAASSATAAQTAANSVIYSDVVYKTAVDSPITLTSSDRGKLLAIDASGGAVTVNLPQISNLDLSVPFSVSVKKTDSSGNAITVNRAGTDTIDGGTASVTTAPSAGATYVADADKAPDDWTSVKFGATAGNLTVDTFVAGVNYTAGTTTSLSLSVAPGSDGNVQVFFDGVRQEVSEWSLSGTTITFSEAIPSGTGKVECVIGTTLTIGTPSDATVSYSKLAADVRTIIGRKNAVINGDFCIAQRGTSFTHGSGYILDRWVYSDQDGASTISQQEFAVGDASVSEATRYFMRFNMTTAATVTPLLRQYIESVRTFAGQKATLSFWAKAGAAMDISVYLQQDFGTGGTPSAAVNLTAQTKSLTTGWAYYTATFDVPSISGKTLGTNGNDSLRVVISPPTGVTFTLDLTEVQLEAGAVATEFERRPIGEELALCRRYFEKVGGNGHSRSNICNGHCRGSTNFTGVLDFEVEKRAPPSLSIGAGVVGDFGVLHQGGRATASGMTFDEVSRRLAVLVVTCGTVTAGDGAILQSIDTKSPEIWINAEL